MRIVLGLTLSILAIGLVAYSYPATAACAFADQKAQSDDHKELVSKARIRIESKFGLLRSTPVIYFFNNSDKYWQRRLNQYGSTSFIGYKTCVAIGPQGQNIDVLAHELMHAEIEERAGFWNRLRKIPVWFDEGLAMQVDFRERYNLPAEHETQYVTELFSSKQFVTDGDLTRNYAAAKAEVSTWLAQRSAKSVYENLSEIRHGTSFDSIWKSTE